MTLQYTQNTLEARINAGIQGKKDILVDVQETMNASARELFNKVDLRTAIRRSVLSPNLFNGIFPYTCPTDLKGYGIIDIPAQAKRQDGEWDLTTPEEFHRLDGSKKSMVAIDDYNGVRTLLLDSEVDSDSILVSEFDSSTDWDAFGDAENIEADDSDFIKGAGSIKWGISSAGGVTAGLSNDGISSFDLTDYLDGTSAFFVWVKITSTTNLTSWILRFGSDSSNYYSKTVTAQADGTAFAAGWNLLKFDVTSLSETGTVADTAIDYVALYMTKAAGKVSETDYKFDWLVLKKGVISYVKYYSKYAWQTAAGSYIENSTTTTDLLNCDTDEFDLVVKQGVVNARKEIGFTQTDIDAAENDLEKAIKNYVAKNPSQAKAIITDYYNY